jgi:peptidoglycan hydrolase-like protein with peptidoglycan-binding domain
LRLRTFAALMAVLILAVPGINASQKAKSAASKKPAATAKKHTAKTTTHRRTTRHSRRRRQSWRYGQMEPTPERYKEIQQALIDKGYLAGPADGKWGAECSTGLKKFQQDQHLDPTGKLDALSLIALGLGPKREPLRPNAVPNSAAAADATGARESQ